jgi:hypothetical protein
VADVFMQQVRRLEGRFRLSLVWRSVERLAPVKITPKSLSTYYKQTEAEFPPARTFAVGPDAIDSRKKLCFPG